MTSSPYINHFIQPDTIVPDLSNPQSWNRYSYVTNRPVNFNDPTGHRLIDDECGYQGMDCGETSSYIPTPQPDLNPGNGSLVSAVPSGSCSGSGCLIDSSTPPGPGCTYTTYCYEPQYLLEPSQWIPDYLAIEVGVPTPLWIFGIDFVLTIDKYNRVYFGLGPSAGTSPFLGLDVNASVSVGYIDDGNTLPKESHSFITRWSGGGCIGVVPGYCRVTGDPFGGNLDNPNNWANQYGIFTPQGGVALPYSVQIFPIAK